MSVYALALSASHEFTKTPVHSFTLVADLGIEGDCHYGVYVQHRSRLHIRPRPPNLRQVHLIPKEILDDCGIEPGQIGENVTTAGLDLLGLGRGTKLHFLPPLPSTEAGDEDWPRGGDTHDVERMMRTEGHPVIVVQGLRNPCPQIDHFRAGLKEKFLVRDGDRRVVGRRAGVMGTVEGGGVVSVGMRIVVERPDEFVPLGVV